jgi:hypothetical protein
MALKITYPEEPAGDGPKGSSIPSPSIPSPSTPSPSTPSPSTPSPSPPGASIPVPSTPGPMEPSHHSPKDPATFGPPFPYLQAVSDYRGMAVQAMYRRAHLAKLLECDKRTIQHYEQRGELKPSGLPGEPCYYAADVEKFLSKRRERGKGRRTK